MIKVFILALTFLINVRGFEERVYEKLQLEVELTGDNYVSVLGLGGVQKTLDFDFHGLTYRSEETTNNQGIFVIDHENKVVSGEFYHTYTYENKLVGAKSDIFVEDGYHVRRITDDHSDWDDVDFGEEQIDTTWWHGENGVSSRRSLSGEIEYTIKWYYTSTALSEAGSLTALEMKVVQGNADSNMAYANSGLNLKVSMAGDLTEWVQNTPVSNWKTEWRNQLTAQQRDEGDIVAIILGSNEGGSWCGVASTIPSSASQYTSSLAFFAIKQNCLSGYVPAHEVGHLQGLSHNVYTTHCIGTGCGNIIKCGDSSAGGRRTVMSYSSSSMINYGITQTGFPCTSATAGSELRTPYFSSPSVQILIDGQSYTTGHSQANSVQTIQLSMNYIPNYATNEPGGGVTLPNCDFVALISSECPTDNGESLPDCSWSMSNGDLCEADSTLPNGDSDFNVNNCGNYDVFKYVCSVSTEQPVQTTLDAACNWVPVTQCPSDNGKNLPNCHTNMSEGDLCEADTPLPNGNTNYNIDNCGGYDVFVFTCSSVQTTPPVETTQQVQTTESGTCDWVAVSSSECPGDNGKSLPECSVNMSEGDLCEADKALPNGETNFNINNCGGYDVFKYSCDVQTNCNYVPISTSECPADNGKSLADCKLNMNEGELCEADSNLPNGATNYNINNCGLYDVFRYTCSPSNVVTTDIVTTQQAAAYSDHGTGKCRTATGSNPAHAYIHGSGFAGCQSSCDSRSDCFGFSVSIHGNCLLWLEDNLVGGGSNWGNAKCFIKNSRRQLSDSDVRAELQAKLPSGLERIRKH